MPRYDEALTHRSHANEMKVADKPAPEFGDAVLDLCVSEMLMNAHPGRRRRRADWCMWSALVSAEPFAYLGAGQNVGDAIAFKRDGRGGMSNVLADVGRGAHRMCMMHTGPTWGPQARGRGGRSPQRPCSLQPGPVYKRRCRRGLGRRRRTGSSRTTDRPEPLRGRGAYRGRGGRARRWRLGNARRTGGGYFPP